MSQSFSERYPNNYIHPTAIVYPNVKMGTGNHIGAYCIIGDVPESVMYFNEPDHGVIIGNNCRFTKQVTIDAGTEKPTQIGDNVLMLKNAHVGHDSVIKDNTQIRCNAIVGGHVTVEEGAKIMLGAIIHPRKTISKNAIIGMGAVVTKKLITSEGITYAGNPAQILIKH